MSPLNGLTRRDFLKLTGAGLFGLFLAELRVDAALAASNRQGRATFSGVPVYDEPAFSAKQLTLLGKDAVVDIQFPTIGEGTYNRVWYRLAGGFTYSGWLQPVKTIPQMPQTKLARPRTLGEVTVPFLDTRRAASIKSKRSMRLYYGSTHWVTDVTVNQDDDSVWYQIYDKVLRQHFYVNAAEMRLVPDSELARLSPDVPDALKSLHVDLATQTVTAFEGEKLVLHSRCASGVKGTRTPLGDYQTYHKGPSIHMTNQGDDELSIYDLPGVPWVSFFTGLGHAFHGTYWHNDFGKPRSHGCVNLPNSAAKFLYRWTSPTVPPETDYLHKPKVGTAVHIISS
ncbi:MAG: L,D-transpeptidase [Chloroflexota bacterium]